MNRARVLVLNKIVTIYLTTSFRTPKLTLVKLKASECLYQPLWLLMILLIDRTRPRGHS